jgi:hypothetical protein
VREPLLAPSLLLAHSPAPEAAAPPALQPPALPAGVLADHWSPAGAATAGEHIAQLDAAAVLIWQGGRQEQAISATQA